MSRNITDSYVFQSINQGDRLQKLILEAMQKGRILEEDDLEQALVTINKSFKYALKTSVLNMVKSKNIVLLYSPDDVRIPTFLPFVINKNSQGKMVAVVFVDIHGKMDKEGNVSIDPKKLYTIMESAYISLLYSRNVKDFNTKTALITNGSEIYANMFARTLNKKYALNLDKNRLHKVMFLAGKFFLINHLGMSDGQTVNNYAIKNCVGGNSFILNDLAEMTNEHPGDFKNLDTLITAMHRDKYNLQFDESLTVRSFIEQFATMYQHSTLLALESYPQFILTVNAALHGSYLNNQYILEDIVDKVGMKQYMEIVRINR